MLHSRRPRAFAIATTKPQKLTVVTISATYAGAKATATLTVKRQNGVGSRPWAAGDGFGIAIGMRPKAVFSAS